MLGIDTVNRVRSWVTTRTQQTCCYLHLGMPKTATTSLQINLFANHSQIKYLGKYELAGIRYPSKTVQELNEYLVSKESPSMSTCRKSFSNLVKSAESTGKVPLWSKEGMTGGGAKRKKIQATRLREICGDCKIIIFVRHPLKFLESIYFQDLKAYQKRKAKHPILTSHVGQSPCYFTLDTWAEILWKLPMKGGFGHLLCSETADAYAEVFGKENVRIFMFEKLVEDSPATIEELCQFIGIEAEQGIRLFQRKRNNNRWTDAHVERLKQIQQSERLTSYFRQGSFRLRAEMIGVDPHGINISGPKARAEIPDKWKKRTIEFVRDDHRRLANNWGLPLKQYGYIL